MKIGNRIVLVNPNVRKLGCVAAIMVGWFFWPMESAYVKYDEKRAELDGS